MGGGDKRSPLSLVKPKPRNGSPSSRVGRRRSSGRTRFIFIKPEHAEQVAKRGSVRSASCLARARKQVKFLPRGENKCPRISQPFYLGLVDVRPPCIYLQADDQEPQATPGPDDAAPRKQPYNDTSLFMAATNTAQLARLTVEAILSAWDVASERFYGRTPAQ